MRADPQKPYSLRPARKQDYDFLYQLIEVCMKEYVEATWGWDDDYQQDHFAKHFDVIGCQIVLVNGREAGQITVIEQQLSHFISGIYILPEFQNMGLGSALVREAMDRAEKDGRPVTLQVLKANEPARRLYKRLGFVETAEKLTHHVMRWDPPPAIK